MYIPGFGYWNDCVNLMPVRPDLVKEELEKYGHDTSWDWSFYKIDAEQLDTSKLIILVMTDRNDKLERKFMPFSKEALDEYCHIGEATRNAFKRAKENGEQPNTFARLPHVLYRESIDTKDLEVVRF